MDATVTCSCCGLLRSSDQVVGLACHRDVVVCAGCVGWMAGQVQAATAVTPILPVRDMADAREFWTAAGVQGSSG